MSLHAGTFIYKYQVDGQDYGIVPKFGDHQSPHPHEAGSKIPNPPEEVLKEIQCHGKSITLPEMSVTSPSDIRNPDIRNPSSNGMFDMFWNEYPKKKSKPDAERAFQKLNPDESLLKKILSAIERAKKSQDWLKDNGQYIPFPATWLNGRRWEDELTIEHKTESDYPSCEKVMRDQGFSKEDLDRP